MIKSKAHIRNTLKEFYSQEEIESFIDLIFFFIYNYSKKDLILKSAEVLSENDFKRIAEVVERLRNHEPIQYIFERAEFYGLKFYVNPNVLIPRNETEELVDLILKKHSKGEFKVLDIGTGSGCIPIALKKNNPDFSVFSMDISKGALEVAKRNAENNNVTINFMEFDILSDQIFFGNDFDLIVSNPPYVTVKEKELMDANVLDNEPHLALFVPNNDPLKFYRAITLRAKSLLNPEGEIYFEINEAYGNEVVELLVENGFSAELIQDLNGKDRIIYGTKHD